MSDEKPPGRAPRRLTIQTLLARARKELDEPSLAATIGVPPEFLQEWTRDASTLALPEKIAIVFAILTLAPDGSKLFRDAATMRGRLAAEHAYQSGLTETNGSPPIRWFGV